MELCAVETGGVKDGLVGGVPMKKLGTTLVVTVVRVVGGSEQIMPVGA